MNEPTLFELPQSKDPISKKMPHKGQPRLKVAERAQVKFTIASLNDMIPQDHTVRLVWEYINQLNIYNILGTIQSTEGHAGRPATDPKILLCLWLYATLEGITSARVLADYCVEHIAFQWICGDVSINHHTLSDFAVKYKDQFDDFLTQSIAIMLKENLISLEEVSQDGMRVRANSGSSSFKKEPKLTDFLEQAQKYLEKLRDELKKNPSANRSKKEAAAWRAAQEREKKVKKAIEELEKLKVEKKKNQCGKRLKESLEKARSSITDAESRMMKMACGGFRPAYNVQFATTKHGRVIVGVDVNQRGNDTGLIIPMVKKVYNKFGILPKKWLVDAGYADYDDLTQMDELFKGCDVYMSPKTSGRTDIDPYKILPKDSAGIAAWRTRMNTEEAKEIYKGRSATAEFSNAQARNKDLEQFLVRGLEKANVTAYRFALTHNMQRYFNLKKLKKS